MKLLRREVLQCFMGATAAASLPRATLAAVYPSRTVRIVVGFAAGGPGDIIARLTGQFLSERLGQPFITDNRPGAGGSIAAQAAVNSLPDGYTLVQVTPSNAISATLYKKLSFNFARDLVPVGETARAPLAMLVNPSLSAKTVPEFIAYAKANPGKINMASAGIGSTPHMAGELFKMMAGVNLVHVPYRGGAPALIDLLSGQMQVLFDPIPASIGYIKAGKLRALAVTTATRSAALPDVPPIADFLPGYEASNWWGLCAPKNTPADIVDKLNSEINAALIDPKIKARLADLGASPAKGSVDDFARLIADETDKWGKVIRTANITAR